jgi:hypothetical protein
MSHFPHQNAILISGGRNDRMQEIFSDLYFLTLDTLTWVKILTTRGQGFLSLADHVLLPCSETDFILFGGVDPAYKLSNKISILTFNEERLWAYSHNGKKGQEYSSSPKARRSSIQKLSLKSPSSIGKMPESIRYGSNPKRQSPKSK